MRTIAIVNQKGGCGKTTTAINLAAVYANRGLRTLLVDLDPQSHCAAGLGVPEKRIEYSIGDAMTADLSRGFDRAKLVWEVARNLDLAPSTMQLATLEAPNGGLHELPDRDRRLERVLSHMTESYDRCLIDCPPTIGLLTFNAMRAAREALIPVETGYFALKGAVKQWETVQRVIRRIGRPIACHILPTLYDTESELARDILVALRRRFAGQIVPIVIHEHDELREAASLGQGVIEFAPDSDARRDFESLADWLAEHQVRPIVDLNIAGEGDEERGFGREPGDASHGGSAIHRGVDAYGEGGRAGELVERLRRLTLQSVDRGDPATLAALGVSMTPADASDAPIEPPAPVSLPDVTTPDIPRPSASPPTTAVSSANDSANDPVSPRHVCGARLTSRGVLFVQPSDGTQVIAVAGDFNSWNPAANVLRYNADVQVAEAVVEIPPGRHQYRIVVDGRWQADPYNDCHAINEHGELNCVIEIPAPVSAPATDAPRPCVVQPEVVVRPVTPTPVESDTPEAPAARMVP